MFLSFESLISERNSLQEPNFYQKGGYQCFFASEKSDDTKSGERYLGEIPSADLIAIL
jgi:hypothetical protein